MKRQMTALIAGTMLAITGGTMSASAIVTGTINQQEIGGQQTTLLLAKKGKKDTRIPGATGFKVIPGRVFLSRPSGSLREVKEKTENLKRKILKVVKKKK